MIGLMIVAAAAALQPAPAAPAQAPRSAGPTALAPGGELWTLDQIRFKIEEGPAFAEKVKALEPDHTMEAVAARLARMGIAYQRGVATLDTSKLPPQLLSVIQNIQPGEPFAVPSNGDMTINQILSRRPKPAEAPATKGAPAKPGATRGQSASAAQAAVDRLFEAMHLSAQLDAVIPRTIDMMLPGIMAGNSDRPEEVRRIVAEEFRDSFLRTKPLLMAKAQQIYLARYSASELDQLATFYQSPLGKKMLAVSPQIGMEMMKFGQDVGRAAGQDALPRVIQRMRAANLKTPQGV